MIHLITGGARAGKSSFALREAERAAEGGVITFIATAEARDDEMTERIAKHRAERGEQCATVEAPWRLASAISTATGAAIVVDCVTMWTCNLICDGVEPDAGALITALSAVQAPVLLVTNEVGLGIVPAAALSRRYQDALGRVNQALARRADHVTLMVCGLPVRVK